MGISSSYGKGSAPGVLGKRKQTPEDLLIYSLEDLTGSDFKRFRNKLSDFSYEDKRPIPRGKLENADWITTKDLLIEEYGEQEALDVTNHVLTLIGLMVPTNNLQKRRTLNDISKEHRESEKFKMMKEYNSCMGEAVHLQERFTNLLMTKGPQNKEGKEPEISSSGRRFLQIMEKRSPTTIQALFDPDKYKFIPEIVVLQGSAGIGKTMTSKKIMLDWASGELYHDKFDFMFYLSCREINTIPGNISLVGLLSRTCSLRSDDLVYILEDPGSQRKLLTIVDGFDELRWTLEEKSEGCSDISMEIHKEIILRSLLRRQVLSQSSLIITTRSLAMEKLNTFIDDSRYVEIQGFTRDDREEYVHKFFVNKKDADKALSIIKDNDVVYTMCAVLITCWIICTAMKQEIRKDLDSIRCHTTTSIYLLYLEVLLTHHSKRELSVDRKQTCLKKLCALANQGVLNQQILFEKKDLERHGLSLDEVESVFLNENIFHCDTGTQTCYSFIHLSVQEFLAALYYGMDDGSGSMEGNFLPEICKGESLTDLTSSQYNHLALQFLYGLLNENQLKTFSKIIGINISLRAKPAMIEWTMKDFDGSYPIHAIVSLNKTQDEDFIRSTLSGCSHLRVYGSQSDDLRRYINYYKELSYCLKTLKRKRFQNLHFECLTVDPECQLMISPTLHRSQTVRFEDCTLHEHGKAYQRTDKKEDDEEKSPSAEDIWMSAKLSAILSTTRFHSLFSNRSYALWLAKSACGDQEEALMKSEEEPENLVTPVVDGKTYRLQLKPGRLFRCSETGIMFKAKSESTVKYELEFGSNNFKKVQNNGYDIVGPVFNITMEPGVVSAVHLPHYLSLEGLKTGIALIGCGHFTGGKFNITKPVKVGSSHIVIENPSSSIFFPALHSKLWRRPIPLEGKVLLYSQVVCPEDVDYMEYKFHLYVVPTNQPQLRKLDKEKKDDGFNHMKKPHQIQRSLYTGTDYAFSVQPHGDLFPEHLQIKINCETENLPFVEVNVDKNVKKLSLSMIQKGFESECIEEITNVLWNVNITKGEMREMLLRARPSFSHAEHFLDIHYEELIQSVANVREVLDKLKDLLTNEQYDIVRFKKTSQDQMKELIRFVRGCGDKSKDELLDVLEKTNKQLIFSLKRPCICENVQNFISF